MLRREPTIEWDTRAWKSLFESVAVIHGCNSIFPGVTCLWTIGGEDWCKWLRADATSSRILILAIGDKRWLDRMSTDSKETSDPSIYCSATYQMFRSLGPIMATRDVRFGCLSLWISSHESDWIWILVIGIHGDVDNEHGDDYSRFCLPADDWLQWLRVQVFWKMVKSLEGNTETLELGGVKRTERATAKECVRGEEQVVWLGKNNRLGIIPMKAFVLVLIVTLAIILDFRGGRAIMWAGVFAITWMDLRMELSLWRKSRRVWQLLKSGFLSVCVNFWCACQLWFSLLA